jgi:hypothetical protein
MTDLVHYKRASTRVCGVPILASLGFSSWGVVVLLDTAPIWALGISFLILDP